MAVQDGSKPDISTMFAPQFRIFANAANAANTANFGGKFELVPTR
jgi:hypothetical protein